MSARHVAATLSMVVALLAPWRAAQAADDDKRVSGLRAVAKSAFDGGRYEDALRALEECYRLTSDSKYLWNIGITAEKSYWATPSDETLRKAVDSYRAYLEKAPKGGKRGLAGQNLRKLEPLLPKPALVDAANPDVAPAPLPTPPVVTRTGVMISSPTPGARIELDGKLTANGFLQADVAAGPHRVRVVAEGFDTVERELPVQVGALVGVDIPLAAKPGLLDIVGPSGAELTVDGEPKGELPLPKPLAVVPGDRLITVQLAGTRPLVAWRTVERGRTYSIDADLDTTVQRYAAYCTFAVAGGTAIAGAVLTGLAFQRQAEAEDILLPVTNGTGSVPVEAVERFEATRSDRDNLRTGAAVAWSVAGAGLTAGIFLFVFDQPSVQAPPAPPKQKGGEPAVIEPTEVELSLLPSFGPGLSGLHLSGRF
jgi:hypothetical protein